MAGFRVAVAGATGLVGRSIVRVLEERAFPVDTLVPMASPRSAGTAVTFRNEPVEVRLLEEVGFESCDFAFFSAGASVSRQWAPIAARHAPLVIDNSSAFREEPSVPLAIPEVNGDRLRGYEGIVANPNCSTIQMVVVLQPLHAAFDLEAVVVSTYQSVSGTGARGVRALDHEVETGQRHPESPYSHPIAFNVLPHVDVLDENGWSGEERKMIAETRKIMDLPALHIVPTTVRVPVRISHSESVYAIFRRQVDPESARRVLAQAPGVVLQDNPATSEYPLAIHAEGKDDVFVGRIRQVPGDDHALAFWVVSDNLRKGAATNAVQIAELAIDVSEARTAARYA
jgi:aspartate-semialdehyde dehydrogenase